MQYPLRHIPKSVDRALRARAKAHGKSLNQTVLDTLQEGLGIDGSPQNVHTDLDWFFGGWVEDPAFDEIMRQQDQVNPDDWK